MSTVIIIGAGYAGILAANRARARGHHVTVVSERGVFVNRIHLHEVVTGSRSPADATIALDQALPGVSVVLARASRVADGAVTLDDGRVLTARHVVLATGSAGGPGGWAWAVAHREALTALAPASRLSVLGAGLTGVETAAEIAEQRPDLNVTLIDPVPLGQGWSGRGRRHVVRALERLGVTISPEPVAADHVIDCTGFTRARLARDSGLPVGAADQVLVDAFLRVPGRARLWACGDAVSVAGQPHLRMACASAEPMAAHVVDQIGRSDRGEPLRALSLGYAGQCVSLGRRDGLLQYVRRDDSPVEFVSTGVTAVAAKRLLCRLAVVAPLRWSRWYRAVGGPRAV